MHGPCEDLPGSMREVPWLDTQNVGIGHNHIRLGSQDGLAGAAGRVLHVSGLVV